MKRCIKQHLILLALFLTTVLVIQMNMTNVTYSKYVLNESNSFPVTVTVVEVNEVNIPSSLTLTVGETEQLTAEISPSNAENKAVIWSVISGSDAADVSSAGLVTALSPGTAVIRATSAAYSTAFDECVVTVVDASSDTQEPTAPTNVNADIKKNVTLMWDPATDDVGVEGYEIYRDGVLLGDTKKLKFKDKDTIPGTTYTYTIRAYDAAGNKSTESESIIVSV